MALYALIITGGLLIILNFAIGRRDWLNPSVIFCTMNFIYSVVCLAIKFSYSIDFHFNTAIILMGGMLIFTLFNILVHLKRRVYIKSIMSSQMDMPFFYINSQWVCILIVFELIVALYMIKYARDVSRAFYGSSQGILSDIGILNNITKNRGDEFRNSGVHASAIYVLGWPLCIAANSIISCVFIWNYKKTHVKELFMLFPSVIMLIMSFLIGSRSTAFRFITAFIIEFIIISRWNNKSYRQGQFKMIVRLIFILSIILIGLGYSINLIGRQTSIPIFEYVTAYVGAPFYNLDIAIQNGIVKSELFGQETFHHLYKFLSSRLGISEWNYSLNLPYLRYHGHYLGNVYTMYFMFLEDFGGMGVVILTSFIAWYYNSTYSTLMNWDRNETCFGVRLFIYGYLFNDLIMLTFSNRFFETTLGTTSILYYFWLFILWYLFRQGLFFSKR
ncbi:MAG: oligosaccharide repeat unit polymerase [Lachnospiraceae bacterium]|nr:oligosaccharide repeat unit polymerase [Lachnospiraceae bacterium]